MPLELTYDQSLGTAGKLDIYLSVGGPVVVLVQHGGWLSVDKRDGWMTPWADAFVAAGYSVVIANWRAATTYKYPIALYDLDHAIRVAERYLAQAYGCIRCPLNLIGFSSGANLAPLWALNRAAYSREHYDPSLQVASLVTLAGPYDLTAEDLPELAETLIGGWMPSDTWRRLASPITYTPIAPGSAPRWLIMHGELDDIVPYTQATAMYAALDAEPTLGQVTLLNYATMGHEIGQYTSDGWADRFEDIVAFIED